MRITTTSFILLFFTLLLSSCLFFNNDSTVLYKKVIPRAPFDAGIIPGVPWIESGWDTAMKGRVIWAVHLYKRGLVKNLIFSGGSVYNQYYEGKIMCLYAEAMGVPKAHCFAETQAEHSVENVYYGKRMADSLGFKNVVLLTDPFQAALLKRYLKKFRPHIHRLPFIVDTLHHINKVNFDIDGSLAKNVHFIAPLPDRESKWKRFQGTRGKKVKQMERRDKREARLRTKN